MEFTLQRLEEVQRNTSGKYQGELPVTCICLLTYGFFLMAGK